MTKKRKISTKSLIMILTFAVAIAFTPLFVIPQNVNATTSLNSVTFVLTNIKGGKIKVHWQSVKGAAGYQIANDHSKTHKMIVQWTGANSSNTYTSIGKKEGKTYKFKMRYYTVKGDKKVWSSWSSVKSIVYTSKSK